jgi:phage terminase large subunit GpA-like protein
MRPDPDLTVSEWADRHRWLSSRASAEPGRNVSTTLRQQLLDFKLDFLRLSLVG